MPIKKVIQAAKGGNFLQLKDLINNNPNLAKEAKKDLRGRLIYPLEMALNNRHYDCAIFLLENHANPSIPYSFVLDKETPLHCAMEKHLLPEILLLLYFDADTTCKDITGCTPLDSFNRRFFLRFRITSEELEAIIKDFQQLSLLENRFKDSANNKEEQINLAAQISSIFVKQGNKIIKHPDGLQYYSHITEFFYKKAIVYYSFIADLYYKQGSTYKNEYNEIAKLLADLHHKTKNVEMENYYKKVVHGDSTSINDIKSQSHTTTLSTPSSDTASFWASPFNKVQHMVEEYKSYFKISS